jgi:hypothetical protein
LEKSMSAARHTLTVGPEREDAFRFERLVNDAAAVAAAGLLGDALELWRGEVMVDIEVHGPCPAATVVSSAANGVID